MAKTKEKEFKVTKEGILAAASKCTTAQATLKIMFPDAFIEEGKGDISKLFQKIDGYKSACAHLKIKPLTIKDFSHELPEDRDPAFALHQANTIRKCFNGKRKIDWTSTTQRKYFIWLQVVAGVGLAYYDYVFNYGNSLTGARLYFLDEDVVKHLKDQTWFIDILIRATAQ